jgi:hypothetical protein
MSNQLDESGKVIMRKRLSDVIKIGSRGLVVAVVLGAPAAALSAPSALAGEYAAFAQCPYSTSGVEGCLVSRTESGEVVIGNKKEAKEKTGVPIVTTQTLQGGFGEANETTGQAPFFAAKNGITLSKTPQKVPGGLLDFVKCNEIKEPLLRFGCEILFENGTTGVNATLELAKPASSIYLNEFALDAELPYGPYPPALVLPAKIHLENTLLGSECYIGSSSEPIELALTSGTTSPPAPNKAIKGKRGKLTSRGEGRILVIKENSLVGNAFSVGKAHGCGLLGVLDGIVEGKLGLPSPAGENTAILNNTIEQASAGAVEESGE